MRSSQRWIHGDITNTDIGFMCSAVERYILLFSLHNSWVQLSKVTASHMTQILSFTTTFTAQRTGSRSLFCACKLHMCRWVRFTSVPCVDDDSLSVCLISNVNHTECAVRIKAWCEINFHLWDVHQKLRKNKHQWHQQLISQTSNLHKLPVCSFTIKHLLHTMHCYA